MTVALIEGMILGLTMSLLIGPGFITIVQTSIHRGLHSGFQVAFGISLSDITLITLSYLGAMKFLSIGSNQIAFGIIGGTVLMGFGLWTYRRRHTPYPPAGMQLKLSTGRFFKYFSKGFLLNIFNPFIFIFWFGVVSLMGAKFGIPSKEILIFFAGTISVIFTMDIIKCFVAQKIRRRLNMKILNLLNRFVGILLFIFGIALITRVIFFR
jgi:threonine/homoserine/homoserine lactone efflux protein